MIETVKNFCERLEIPFTEELLPFYQKGAALYAAEGARIIDTDALRALNTKYNIFRKHFELILTAAEKISADADLMLYISILSEILADAAMPVQLLPPPDRKCIETDFAPLFAYVRHFPMMIERMEARGLPHSIISDTMHEFEGSLDTHRQMYGRPGTRTYVAWFRHWITGDILRIGRLNFEMTRLKAPIRVYRRGEDIKILMDGADIHEKGMLFGSAGQNDESGKFHAEITETDGAVTGYAANRYGECMTEPITLTGYTEVLRKGDAVLNVHIPARDPLSEENCAAAYADALKIIGKCYPEALSNAFICNSWMMEKRLKDIMGRETNITRFMDRFTGFPLRSDGRAVYTFLYRMPDAEGPEVLPEDSSMRRIVKDWLIAGNYIYEKGGVFFV